MTEKNSTPERDRKSTRLNSSHRCISYAVFCLKKKNKRAWQCRLRRYRHQRLLFWRRIQGNSAKFFFFKDTAPTEISPLPLPDALPIWSIRASWGMYLWGRNSAPPDQTPI